MKNFQNIFGLLFIGFFIFLYCFHKKENKRLDSEMKQNPELKEKLEIEKSKNVFMKRSSNKSLDIGRENPLLAILIAVFAILLGAVLSLTRADAGFTTFSLFSMMVLIIALIICIRKCKKYTIKSMTFDALKKKYGEIEICEIPKPKIVQGKKAELGNIRNNYIFSYKVLKYNCLFSNFTVEELTSRRSNYSHGSYYVYLKIKNMVLYEYDLTKLGMMNIDDDILSYPSVKQAIEDLNKIKILNVRVQNNNLIIEKETLLSYYVVKDFERDINDIELFYDKIVKEIMRGVR